MKMLSPDITLCLVLWQHGPPPFPRAACCLSHLLIDRAWYRPQIQHLALWSADEEEQWNGKEKIIIHPHCRGVAEVWQWAKLGGERGGRCPRLYFPGAGRVVPCWKVYIGKAGEKRATNIAECVFWMMWLPPLRPPLILSGILSSCVLSLTSTQRY